MVDIDAFLGYGGGQILRTTSACALCKGLTFHMFNIRDARKGSSYVTTPTCGRQNGKGTRRTQSIGGSR